MNYRALHGRSVCVFKIDTKNRTMHKIYCSTRDGRFPEQMLFVGKSAASIVCEWLRKL